MFSAVILALISVASAQFVSNYPSTYGSVNPIVSQNLVPHVNHNYQYANQKVIPSTYGYQSGLYGYGVNNGYNGFNAHTYATPAQITYDRDFNIEQVGEKYAYQSGPASFNYHFVKGADVVPQQHAVVAQGIQSYGVPHHARVSAAVPAFQPAYSGVYAHDQYVPSVYNTGAFSGKFRTATPVVSKYDTYSAKDLIAAH
jgi:hypothetical protein